MFSKLQLTVIGKVFKPNSNKLLDLNKVLEQYFKCVKWYISFDSTSKKWLHDEKYEDAKRLFDLKTALIQSARDKAVEMLKSFKKTKKQQSILKPKRICIRFDKRSYKFDKTDNSLTPYWLSLSLNGHGRTSFPVIFGDRESVIDRSFNGEFCVKSVEMKKKGGEWFAHFTLEKEMECPDDPSTIIGIDRGDKNFAVSVAIKKDDPSKPVKGQFWNGNEIKALKGKYHHIRRNLGRKKRPQMIKKIKDKLKRKTDQQLHILANDMIDYVSQFEKPIIVMEDLTNIRKNFKKGKRGKKLNRRMNSLPFRKLQDCIEYKALGKGIQTVYIDPKNTSKECHRCGKLNNVAYHRDYECSNCGLKYDRDLNASINIAHRITSSMGWGTGECPEQPNDVSVAKT